MAGGRSVRRCTTAAGPRERSEGEGGLDRQAGSCGAALEEAAGVESRGVSLLAPAAMPAPFVPA